MIWQCSHQIWCRSVHAFFKSPMLRLEHPLKRTKNLSLNVNNLAVDWPVSLKFGTYIDHMMPDLPHVFKFKGSKVKAIASQAWYGVLAPKNRYISWTDSLTEFKLISLKFCTQFDCGEASLPHMFKVKGHRSRSRGQSSRSQCNVTYEQ